MVAVAHPPSRESAPSLAELGVELHPDTLHYVAAPQELADAIGGHSLKDVFANPLVFAAAFSACMGGLLFGFDQGILSIVYIMPQFLEYIPEVDPVVSPNAAANKGIMTGLLELGAFIGAICSGWLADKVSRKGALLVGAIIFIMGSILQAACQNFAMLVVGRTIGGIGVGMLAATAPMYISEIAPPNCRGAFLALEGSAIVIGIVIMFYITVGTRHIQNLWSFRLPFTIQMAPVIFLFIGLYMLPYSPRWLAQVGRDREALTSLSRLRRLPTSDPRIQAEWLLIRAEALRSHEVLVLAHPNLHGEGVGQSLKLEFAGWVDMFRPKIVKRTMIGVMLMLFQQFQGINALIYYSPTIFGELGLDTEMQVTMSGVLNVTQMVATCSAFFLLDRVGRRPPLMFGSIGNTISHFVVAGIIGKFSGRWEENPAAGWAGVAFVLFFMFSFGVGWSPVPWAMPAEVHSSSRRAKGVAITTACNWAFNAVIGFVTPPMIERIGFGTFIFFGAFSLLSLGWTIWVCPETKEKTLEELDAIFGHHTAGEESEAHRQIISVFVGRIEQFEGGEGGKSEQEERIESVQDQK